MRTLFDRVGGVRVIDAIVDDFSARLLGDARVQHHFTPERMPTLKAGQRDWLAHTLGSADHRPTLDLKQAHHHLVITDDQISAVVGHLDAAIADAGVDDDVRRQVVSLVSRLWFARDF
jgi:hemoglobin